MSTTAATRKSKGAKGLAAMLRSVDELVDAQLGADEAARRIRRYVADHDAPSDDRTAFCRLCLVIFAQGLGFDTVLAKLDDLDIAFAGFDPAAVASFDDARIAEIMKEPIIRNEPKIRACIENAKRWLELAPNGSTFLARVAELAAADDAPGGWPALVQALRDDFVRIGEPAARQTLKRWGFFTAFAHPGAHRVIQRLGFVDAEADAPAVQRTLGAAAEGLGRDPYYCEAALALFAGIGPCRKEPRCGECALSDKCPSAKL